MSSEDDDKPLLPSVRGLPGNNRSAPRSTAAKQVKKVEVSDDDVPLAPPPLKRSRTTAAASRRKTRKREQAESSEDDEEKPKRKKATSKKPAAKPKQRTRVPQTRKKSPKEEVEEDDATKVKLHFKDGQKYLSPPKGDGTRAFYESLLKENPNSVMANKYCIEHGVLIGTQHKEQWVHYQQLRDLGAFKGVFGGVKSQFKDGISGKDVEIWMQMKEIKTGGTKRGTTTSTKRKK